MGGDAVQWLCAGVICERRAWERVNEKCEVCERFESRTCQYSAIFLLPPADRAYAHFSRANTFTARCRQKNFQRYSHTQLSPKSVNCRHSSTRAHCEEAASQVRSDSRADTHSTLFLQVGPYPRLFETLSPPCGQGAVRGMRRSGDTRDNKERGEGK